MLNIWIKTTNVYLELIVRSLWGIEANEFWLSRTWLWAAGICSPSPMVLLAGSGGIGREGKGLFFTATTELGAWETKPPESKKIKVSQSLFPEQSTKLCLHEPLQPGLCSRSPLLQSKFIDYFTHLKEWVLLFWENFISIVTYSITLPGNCNLNIKFSIEVLLLNYLSWKFAQVKVFEITP